MHYPALCDTIVAVSTGWQSAAMGIVRLSGPEAAEWVVQLGVEPPGKNLQCAMFPSRVVLDTEMVAPADVLWFRAPHSYTGQDVIELHLPGSLPLLRAVCERLIQAGARRALPGEFSARAFLNQKLDAAQLEGVLSLLQASRLQDLRFAARGLRDSAATKEADWAAHLTDLLTRVEAGIDFVDEDDVTFITPAEARNALDHLLCRLPATAETALEDRRAARPHIALAGPPNAGKSTLFNALVGAERAIVSPVLGTTRDVLSAEIALGATRVVLQDCAGLGPSADELELAAHLASEGATDVADLVVWVHAVDADWPPHERTACARLPAARRVLVWSKTDLAGPARLDAPLEFGAAARVSAANGTGLATLRDLLLQRLGALPPAPAGSAAGPGPAIRAALERARDLVEPSGAALRAPELLALELRTAVDLVSAWDAAPVDERILARIYAEFCVGK